MDQNNGELIQEIQETENALHRLEGEKDPKAALVPGRKIEALIRQLAEQEAYGRAEISNWRNEVWKSLEQINEEIEHQERGYLIAYQQLERYSANRVRHIQNAAAMQLEALESALIETKLKLKREIDQANMQLEDHLARDLNSVAEQPRIDALVKKFENGVSIENVREA